MSQLPLDHVERDALSSHFDGVGVAQLMWREPAPNASRGGKVAKVVSRRRADPGG